MTTTTRTVLWVLLAAVPLTVVSVLLYKKLDRTQTELAAANTQITKLNATVTEIEAAKLAVTQKAEMLDTALKAVKVEAEALNVQLGTTGADLKTTTAKVTELQQRAEAITKELAATKQTADALKMENTKLAQDLSKAESDLGSAKALIKDLQGQIAGMERKLQEQAVAHAAKVDQMSTQISGLEQTKAALTAKTEQLTTAVVTTKAELSAYQSDPDSFLLGAQIKQLRKSAVGRNDAQKAIGFLGGIFDYFGNESMKSKEAKEGPQGDVYWAVIFRDGSQKEIPALEVEAWQQRINRISTLWGNGQQASSNVTRVIR